jgi:hypothetical protein
MNLDDDLKRLPAHDVPPEVAAQIRDRALETLLQQPLLQQPPQRHSPGSRAAFWRTRLQEILEPALLLGLGALFVLRTFQHTLRLFQ